MKHGGEGALRPAVVRRSQRSSSTVRRLAVMGALVTVASVGCASLRHGGTLQEFQGHLLRVQGGPGEERLKIEADFDPVIRNFLAQNQRPDYIYVQDARAVQLIFIADDRIVLFQRPWYSPNSRATVTEGIPGPLSSLFSREDQVRLGEARSRLRDSATPSNRP